MKKIYLSVMAVVVMCTAVFAQSHYNGNNNTGFGGPVGAGSLDVSDDGVNLTFQFNKGSNSVNDVLVIYIDAGIGGDSTTANFTDEGDGLRKAVSGYTTTNNSGGIGRSTFNFFTSTTGSTDSNFTPEYAIAFQPGNGVLGSSALFALQDSASHIFITTPIVTNSNSTTASTYTIIVPLAQLGFLGSNINFKFITTYISNTAYRSDEAIGDPMTGFVQGWNLHTEVKTPLYYPLDVLPVVFGNVSAKLYNKTITLSWNSLSETNTKSFLVQKSANGSSFATIATQPAQNKSTGAAYTYNDNGQLTANNYYRIVAVDRDGRQTSSRIVSVENIAGSASVKAYFTSHVLNIKMSNPAAARYEFVLFAANGQKIASTVYQHPGGESSTTLPTAVSLPKGVYYLSAQSGTERQTIRVFVP